MTPQPDTDLMPVNVDTSDGVESIYARAARQGAQWLDTAECSQRDFAPANTVQTSNWGGWQIGGGTAPRNHYVQGAWNVPVVTLPAAHSPANTYLSGTWVGLGGGIYVDDVSAAHPLIQAGTEEIVDSISGAATYYFFHEVWPEPPKLFTNIPIAPGDEVAADVFWMPKYNAAQLAVCNFTQNVCLNFYNTNVQDQYGDVLASSVGEPGNTTEWIHEPASNSSMPAFSQINFNNACWASTTTYDFPVTGDQLTGSVTCLPMTEGPSLLPLQSVANIYATPSTIGSTGSDFYIYNGN